MGKNKRDKLRDNHPKCKLYLHRGRKPKITAKRNERAIVNISVHVSAHAFSRKGMYV